METKQKAKQIFEYLLAVKNLSMQVERDMSKYESIWWVEELPNLEGCHIGGTGRNENAWLEVHKQRIPAPPAIPKILDGWLEGKWSEPDATISIKNKIVKEDNQEIYFEDVKERVQTWEKWIKIWNEWAKLVLPQVEIQKIYGELFTLYQRFQREEETIELVWGHGLLVWNYKGIRIQRPLFETSLELLFDAENGVFEIVPTQKATVLETDMLNNLDIPNIDHIASIERNVNQEEINPWEKEIIEPLLKEIAHTLSPMGKAECSNISKNKIKFYDEPIIYNTSMFFTRSKATRQWQSELRSIIEAIDNGFPIPATITSLTSTELKDIYDYYGVESQEEWGKIGEEILFPLEANSEQKEIVKRLASNYGVVVQGPPGTGKSHTIANLICHLLAQGKKVLVTSQTEKALRVLIDKIPEAIRHLCVNVAGGDSQSLKEIEKSIRVLSENLSSMNIQRLKKDIERNKRELKTTRDTLAKLRYNLKQAAIKEHGKVIFEGKEFLPLEIAQWVKDNEKHNWLPDRIHWDVTYPEENKMLRFFHLAGSLSKPDLDGLSQSRPDIEKLPSPTEFSRIISSWSKEEKKTIECKPAIQDWKNINDLSIDIETLIGQIKLIIDDLDQFNKPWLQKILEDTSKGRMHYENWEVLTKDSRGAIQQLINLNRTLAPYKIEISTEKPYVLLKEDFCELRQYYAQNKVNWMFTKITGRKYSYLFQTCKINGCPVKNLEDTEIIIQHVDKVINTELLINKWNSYMTDIDGEFLQSTQPRLISIIDEHLTILEKALNWGEVTKPLKTAITKYCVKGIPNWTDKAYLEKLKLGFEAIAQQRKFLKETKKIEELKTYLNFGAFNGSAHKSWHGLLKAIEDRNPSLWETYMLQLQRLKRMEPLHEELKSLTNFLREIAPRWTEDILNRGGTNISLELPKDWREAWKWSKFNAWLLELHGEFNTDKLQQQVENQSLREKNLLEQIIADSTWMKQFERTTEVQKRSLFAWMQSIRKIGQGKGKYAEKHRKDAKREMEICRGAIPVWIMPIHRVIENIKISKELFDVVIVDESSQSDLFALTVFFRAKKAVIVGDDKQISPESVGTDQSEINDLIRRYLAGIPQNHKFDMQTSLYDTALRIFPGNIMLKEHFRCVPEIIQFSNDLCYGGSIEPLRFPKASEMLTPPLKAVRVKEGRREENTIAINEPEAKSLVNSIVECCKDVVYNNKTMGVISLQGFHQAKLIEDMLREELGEQEMHKRKLICGDAYSFQGDERNVIFLSMVAANNVKFRALTSLSDERRFNVAVSRAKDQVWLFHSVDLDDLSPSCLRARLLRYVLQPNRITFSEKKVEHLFESDFERDVFRLITARGYAVRPQVQVGSYRKRIDLVVEGIRNRLAVECDGDKWHGPEQWEADQERQQLLERVGWKFWRVSGSTFYRNPDEALRTLWAKLEEMGITPQISNI